MAVDTQGSRLQPIRDFTVQVRDPNSGEIVGTGIVVSLNGDIVTCAHVAEQALGMHPRGAGDAEVEICFPRLPEPDRKRRATVAAVFPQHDDDVVLLRLTSSISLTAKQVAVLGTAEQSEGHPFKSYGYRQFEGILSGWAHGKIQGPVEIEESTTLHAEPIELQSNQIDRGMSGSGVLDTERNLVIGLISETWYSEGSVKDQNTAWAVDARVLSLDPLGIGTRLESLPLVPGPQANTDAVEAREVAGPKAAVRWNTAPGQLTEWVGRADLMAQLTEDWADPQVKITGLIGFAGEGKSSLARRWVEAILKGDGAAAPDGVFWWGFSELAGDEQFFDQVLDYLTGGRVEASKIRSVAAKAQFAGAMLGAGRYLFVLDGLEVVQRQEGDRFGGLVSRPLTDFLDYLAAPDNPSFGIITSRLQLHDLEDYQTYRERDVNRLTEGDGVALLRKLKVRGPREQLANTVRMWDGHALTLSLIGSYLVHAHQGDITKMAVIRPPTDEQHPFVRASRVLRSYDAKLDRAATSLLTYASALRGPATPVVVIAPFAANVDLPPSLQALKGLDPDAILALVNRLVDLRLLRYIDEQELLTTHPLVRAHYRLALEGLPGEERNTIHSLLAAAYSVEGEISVTDPKALSRWRSVYDNVPLSKLTSGIEAIHHACAAGDFALAAVLKWFWLDLDQDSSYLLVRLGAAATELDLCLGFFPDRDLSRIPVYARMLLETAHALHAVGRLDEALDLARRSVDERLRDQNYAAASAGLGVMADLLTTKGDLDGAERASARSLEMLEQVIAAGGADEQERDSYSLSLAQAYAFAGRIASWRGAWELADQRFQRARAFFLETGFPGIPGLAGVSYAEHLRRRGDLESGRLALDLALQSISAVRRQSELSEAYLVSARLAEAVDERSSAGELHRLAVRNAYEFGSRRDIVAALIGRGSWAARTGDPRSAAGDLEAALDETLDLGYRLDEADAHVGLAWVRLADGDLQAATVEAQVAQRLAEKTGYHVAHVDATSVLKAIKERT